MWAIQMKECGDPGNVMFVNKNAPKPKPSSGEVLIKMKAFTVNPCDFLFIRGAFAVKPHIYPATVGAEGVGVIENVLPDENDKRNGTGLLPGTRVVFWHGYREHCTGSWAEYCVIPENECFKMPYDVDTLSDEKAAGTFLNPLTMMAIMEELGMDVENITSSPGAIDSQNKSSVGPKPGDWILQNAANSTCAKFLTQFLKLQGLKTISVVRRSEQIEFLKEIGSDVVISTDQKDFVDLKTEVYKVTNGKGVKFALDCIYGSKIDSMLECLDVRGTLMSYGLLEGPVGTVTIWPLLLGLRSLRGFAINTWQLYQSREKIQKFVNISGELHATGGVKIPIKLFPYENALDGLKLAEKPNASVKVVIAATNIL